MKVGAHPLYDAKFMLFLCSEWNGNEPKCELFACI